MTTDNTKTAVGPSEGGHFLCDDWFDPLETGVRGRIRGFIEELLEAELDSALGRHRYERGGKGGAASSERAAGSRHGHRERGLMGTFGATTIRVPRARLTTPHGKTAEWRQRNPPGLSAAHSSSRPLIASAFYREPTHVSSGGLWRRG